jgi:pilus assembly protein FimV
MKTVSILVAAVVFAAIVPRDGWALGLGELTLYSYLNEPFRAEVALLEADALDDNDVHVALASDTEFERLGVSRSFFLTRIKFQIESDESGRRVVLTTEAPLREPYLDFVVEARWPDGRLLREYTVLIDLPPRPEVSAREVAPVQEAAPSDSQAELLSAETASAEAGGYATAAAMRPAPGSQYLVTNADTLWRIASDGAAAGISVEQTMLEIVAANPAAFQAGNINGLMSGFILQIPDAGDIEIDLATALDEVALQNEEWAQSASRDSQGLRLVADEEAETTEISNSALADPGSTPDALLAEGDADPADDEAPLDASAASTVEALEALITTVSRLQESVDRLETQLAERDLELASLRSALAEQQASTPAPVVVKAPTVAAEQPTSVPQPISLWSFLAGFAALLAGGGLLIWRRMRRQAESEPLERDDSKDAPAAEIIDEASNSVRLSDPQIMASKAVEDAQIYIAYGRTDQAVEVLNDALAEGLTSVSLNMCLLECYVELEQFAEAGALLGRLEQQGNPELLRRAREMLLASGMTLSSPPGDAVAHSSEEGVEESKEASVLSELSFSAEPAFDLNDGQNLNLEPVVEWVDPAQVTNEHPFEADEFEESSVDEHLFQDGASITEPESEASSSAVESEQGLQLAPIDSDADTAETPLADNFDMDESIHGVETNPVDSKLDLARAYLDMGDEDGARPVLMEVIKEGDLAQQAEARELLLRLEAS